MEILKVFYDDMKNFISSIAKNDADLRLRICAFAFIILLTTIVFPIILNLLAIFELNLYMSVYENFSSLKTKNELIINSFNNIQLPISELNYFINNIFNIAYEPISKGIKIFSTVYYVGFDFKYEVFRSVYLLNNIIFIIAGIVFVFSKFDFKVNNFMTLFILILSVILIILFVNFIVSSIISRLTCIIIYELAFTKIFVNAFSMPIHAAIYKKIIGLFNCKL